VSQPAGEPRPARFSLRGRLSLLVALTVAIAVALVSLGAYFTVQRVLYAQFNSSLERTAVNAATGYLQIPPPGTRVPSYYALSGKRVAIVNAEGDVLVHTTPSPPISDTEVAVARGGTQRVPTHRTDEKTDTRVVAVPYRGLQGAALVVAQSLRGVQSTLRELAIVLAVIGVAGIVAAAAAGTVIARGGLRPVLRLTRATERVAETGDLRPIPVASDDELGRLTRSFNGMLEALGASQDQQRRLVADAGHELRTPLTSLRTNLELLISADRPDAPALTETDREDIHADLHAQLDELTTLVGDLVLLARDEAPHTESEPVELAEVSERALERAQRRGGDVRFESSIEPWTVAGDAGVLERAVLNLLDNAVKFSPPGGAVRLTLRPLGDGTAVVEVADSGPGIADEDLPKVFDRFYRSLQARTLPGSGLGLAIVKQAARLHGGAVFAGHSPDGGALLALRLPGASSPGATSEAGAAE
jgi:two-component system sensor histidine kinase MprB